MTDVPQDMLDALKDAQERYLALRTRAHNASEAHKEAKAALAEAESDLRQSAAEIVDLENRDKFPAESPLAALAGGRHRLNRNGTPEGPKLKEGRLRPNIRPWSGQY